MILYITFHSVCAVFSVLLLLNFTRMFQSYFATAAKQSFDYLTAKMRRGL